MTRSSRKRCARWSAGCSARSRRPGLPGEHHFYITFKTGAAGVDIPKHLSEKFPDEMTIVIQNRFWDLKVSDDGFEVGLSFNQAPAKLCIPFAAITGFVDPAVNFALQFQAQGEEPALEEHEQAENDPPVGRADRGRLQRRLGRFQPEEVTPHREQGQHERQHPHRNRQLRADRGPGGRLLGRADPALDREFPVRAARADAGRDRPRSGLRQAGGGAGQCARRRARRRAGRGDPAGGGRGRERRP